MVDYVIEHGRSYGNYTLTADAFWKSVFGGDDKVTHANGCTKAVFLAAVKAGIDAIQ